VQLLNLEAGRITVEILLIFLLCKGERLNQAAEGLLLQLLLHLNLAKIEKELICTFHLTACLLNESLDLLNGLWVLV
jgi:hypothetical protein